VISLRRPRKVPAVARHELYYHIAWAPFVQVTQLGSRTSKLVVFRIQIYVEIQVPIQLMLGHHYGAARLLARVDHPKTTRTPYPDQRLVCGRTYGLRVGGSLSHGRFLVKGCQQPKEKRYQ
jgi:hypothetical protein